MPFGQHGFYAPPGEAPLPYGKPGPMSPAERFMFETCGVSQIHRRRPADADSHSCARLTRASCHRFQYKWPTFRLVFTQKTSFFWALFGGKTEHL